MKTITTNTMQHSQEILSLTIVPRDKLLEMTEEVLSV